MVCLLKWSNSSNSLLLASVDVNGVIIIWNVLDSTPLTAIISSNETKTISFLQWICLDREQSDNNTINSQNLQQCNNFMIPKHDSVSYKSNNIRTTFILAFYQKSSNFVFYDAELGEPVLKMQTEYFISQVAFNPFFQFCRSCDSSVYNLLFGFKSANNDEKLYFGLARLNESDFISASTKEPKKINLNFDAFVLQISFFDSSNRGNRFSRYDLITSSKHEKIHQHLLKVSDTAHYNNSSVLNSNAGSYESFIQLEYHKSVRDQIFIVFPRDIYLVDFSIETIISVIPIERNCSKIIKIFSCFHRNAFFAFHETGNVSFRLYQKKVICDRSIAEQSSSLNHSGTKRKTFSSTAGGQQSFLNVGYINLCQSEPIRLTKQNKIFGFSISPFDETRVAFLLSSGRIVIKSLMCQKMLQDDQNVSHGYILNKTVSIPCLGDIIKPQQYKLGSFLVSDNGDENKLFDSVVYKMIVTHFISGLNSLPTVIRMCPPLTLMNINKHKPLLAVGDSLGLLQIWLLNNNTATLHREFSVHSYQIAGVEWTSLNSLISYSYPCVSSPSHTTSSATLSAFNMVTGSGSSSGKVSNELLLIDIDTGKVTPFRTNSIHDSSPIETVRVSHLKQYLIILFKRDDPFEIWDVKTLTLLRVMSKSMSNISAIEWNPLYNKKQLMKSVEVSDSDTSQSTHSGHIPIKENFIVTSKYLFHFSIEGNIVKELARIPPDNESGNVNVTSIAWKSDQVLLGDASGTLNVWDLKRKISHTEPTFQGYIRKIRFGPGRGNMKCLILFSNFSVDIWDINGFKVCAQLKYPRDMGFKIVDVDWASCDLPILCTSEGFIFVTDIKLKSYSSPINIQSSTIENNLFDGNVKPSVNLNVNFMEFDAKRDLIRNSMFVYPLKPLNIDCDEESDNITRISNQLDIKKYIDFQILTSKLFSNLDDYIFWFILNSILFGEELDSNLDLFMDETHFRLLQQEKLLLLESNRKTYSQARFAYQLNLKLKNFHRAVQILLETESFLNDTQSSEINNVEQSVFYVDALKACLVASLQSDITTNQPLSQSNTETDLEASDNDNSDLSYNNQFKYGDGYDGKEIKVAPVVKLVATSLIANDHIMEGVELLNFIAKTADSCRYLQSSEKWLDSIWLAKVC